MRIIQALETEYSMLRAINSSEGDFLARILATSVLAGQAAPLFARLAMSINNFSATKALMIYVVCFIAALLFVDRRRDKLSFQITKAVGLQQRLVLVIFIFVTSVGLFMVAKFWPYLALFGYCLVAMFPLHLLIKTSKSGDISS